MAMSMKDNQVTHNVVCPYCHKETAAHEVYCLQHQCFRYIIVRCLLCNEFFFLKQNGEYEPAFGLPVFESTEIYPSNVNEKIFSKEINDISCDFQKLYNEALQAEAYGLENICGLAYRRAFEFLIRDFACYVIPDKKDEILSDNNFSNVISNRLPNTNNFEDIKEISKRAWWVGSDYAHYNKKYEDVDIKDLKQMIEIVILNIESYVKTEKYKQLIKK